MSSVDLTDTSRSKVVDEIKSGRWCPGCLIPVGVVNAASLETGLVSRSPSKEEGHQQHRVQVRLTMNEVIIRKEDAGSAATLQWDYWGGEWMIRD